MPKTNFNVAKVCARKAYFIIAKNGSSSGAYKYAQDDIPLFDPRNRKTGLTKSRINSRKLREISNNHKIDRFNYKNG